MNIVISDILPLPLQTPSPPCSVSQEADLYRLHQLSTFVFRFAVELTNRSYQQEIRG